MTLENRSPLEAILERVIRSIPSDRERPSRPWAPLPSGPSPWSRAGGTILFIGEPQHSKNLAADPVCFPNRMRTHRERDVQAVPAGLLDKSPRPLTCIMLTSS